MISKVPKWDNSQGLRLSKDIVVKKALKPRFDLADLVAGIPKGWQPHEESLGPSVGKEEW